MKSTVLAFLVLSLLILPAESYGLGLELAVGGWSQSPGGSLGYKGVTTDDTLEIDGEANYDDETRPFGRAKLDMPAFVPNIYLMATPMEFEGTGRKTTSFRFGDRTFDAGTDVYSKLTLDHYDIALYYGLPFLETATAGMLEAELGINARIIDLSAEARGVVSGVEESESVSVTVPVPMLYAAAALNPSEWLALEAEARGIAISGDHYYDFIGRVKVKPFGPFFLAAGWRHEDLEIDEEDVEVDLDFGGPFAEAGLEF